MEGNSEFRIQNSEIADLVWLLMEGVRATNREAVGTICAIDEINAFMTHQRPCAMDWVMRHLHSDVVRLPRNAALGHAWP